jgi:enoyl-CoA hydratase
MRIGLVTELVDDDQLSAAALRTAAAIVNNAPFSVEQTKRVMWMNLHAAGLDSALELENHIQILAMMKPEFLEAVDAFVAKRKPIFS